MHTRVTSRICAFNNLSSSTAPMLPSNAAALNGPGGTTGDGLIARPELARLLSLRPHVGQGYSGACEMVTGASSINIGVGVIGALSLLCRCSVGPALSFAFILATMSSAVCILRASKARLRWIASVCPSCGPSYVGSGVGIDSVSNMVSTRIRCERNGSFTLGDMVSKQADGRCVQVLWSETPSCWKDDRPSRQSPTLHSDDILIGRKGRSRVDVSRYLQIMCREIFTKSDTQQSSLYTPPSQKAQTQVLGLSAWPSHWQ